MDKDTIPASQGMLDNLKLNMLKTGQSLYNEIFQDEIFESILGKGVSGEDFAVDKTEVKAILSLDSNVSLMLMGLCVIFRSELIANNPIEKQFLLKRCIMICHEGYKYLFDFGNRSTECKAQLSSLPASKKKKGEDITKAASEYAKLYANSTYKQIRDVSKHYSYDSLEFYSCIKDLSERAVSEMIAKFMSFVQPLHNLSNLLLGEDTGVVYALVRLQTPHKQVIRNIFDTTSIDQMNHTITTYGNVIGKIGMIIGRSMKLFDKLHFDSNNHSLKPFFSDNIAQHIFYVCMDVICAMKAFANSSDFFEQSMHLAYVRLSIHEGFKKLFGFTEQERSKSFWTRIRTDLQKSCEHYQEDIDQIEEQLTYISSQEYVKNDKVVIFTHYGEHQHNSIPYEVLTFFATNARKDYFELQIKILRTLNSIVRLTKNLLVYENERQQQENERWIDEFSSKVLKTLQTARERSLGNAQNQKAINDLIETVKTNNDKLKGILR